MDGSNRSNGADRVVRVITVYGDGHVSHRDVTKRTPAAPWTRGTGWGRAGAHAAPDDGPGEPAAPVKVKDPRKVAAGKARAAQAKAQREAAEAAKKKAAERKAKAAKAPAKAKAAKAKPAKAGKSDAMVVVAFRCTPAQKTKFDKLGGGEWARKRIDGATV